MEESITLVYLYRPGKLRADLRKREAEEILKKKGYNCENPSCCIVQLVQHLANDSEFWHEIGLFLGYPPYDVKCFMKNPKAGVQCSGCWKAYRNREGAAETFEQFARCTKAYKMEAEKGKPLEELIV